MKAVKAELTKNKPERVEAFEKGAQAFAKKIVANFKDYEFVSTISPTRFCDIIVIKFLKVHWRGYEP